MAKECRHDLIVIDLLMPNLNGFNAAKQISTSVPGVPIVLHTLYGGDAVEHEAKKFGVHAVVTKVGSRPLKKVIEQILVGTVIDTA
jgi:CheY-like chemotaxis protein